MVMISLRSHKHSALFPRERERVRCSLLGKIWQVQWRNGSSRVEDSKAPQCSVDSLCALDLEVHVKVRSAWLSVISTEGRWEVSCVRVIILHLTSCTPSPSWWDLSHFRAQFMFDDFIDFPLPFPLFLPLPPLPFTPSFIPLFLSPWFPVKWNVSIVAA